MRTLSALVAVFSLFLAVAVLPVVGGVLFAFFLVGVFGLALVAVVGGVEERTVRARNPSMNPRAWRDGS